MPVWNTDPLMRSDGFRRPKVQKADPFAKFSKTYNSRWDFALALPPKYSMRPKVVFGSEVKEEKYEIKRKTSYADRPTRSHVRTWSALKVKNWFKDALRRRGMDDYIGNIPEQFVYTDAGGTERSHVLDGKHLLMYSKARLTDEICAGDKETATALYEEIRCVVEEYKATHPYDDIKRSVCAARSMPPVWSIGKRYPIMVGKTETPAPGHYKANPAFGCGPTIRGPHPQIAQVPRFVMSQAARGHVPNKNPGPTHYKVPAPTKDPAQPWSPKFSIKGRDDAPKMDLGTPLGAYDVTHCGRYGPFTPNKWSIVSRIPLRALGSTPAAVGPATYKVDGLKRQKWPTGGEECNRLSRRAPEWTLIGRAEWPPPNFTC